jgi:glycosyltransferase involved in cell wall biosynthesis
VRILIVTLDPPGNVGGIEGRAEAYAKNLIDMGHFVEVVSFERIKSPAEGSLSGAVLYRLPLRLGSIPLVASIAARDEADGVFLLSGGSSLIGITLLAFCRLGRRRSIILYYGRDVLRARRRPFGRLLILTANLLTGATAANSAFTAGLFRRESVRQASILYPGVDPDLPELLGPAPGHPDAREVLFVGRLVPRKCADVLIESFASVTGELKDVRLEVVGDGPEMGSLVGLANRLRVSERVRFHGELRGKPLWRRYSECELLVLPSRTSRDDVEGFGTVFLEAAVFAKPSIGTRTGGIPEAIVDNETGMLIEAPQADTLANAMTSLLNDNERRTRFGENARRRAVEHFSWAQSTRALLQALRGTSSP